MPVAGGPLVVPFTGACAVCGELIADGRTVHRACVDAPRSPVHGSDATPEPVVDEPATARVLTPSDAQLQAERLLGISVTVTRLTLGGEGWRVKVEGPAFTIYRYGTCDDVFGYARRVLEGGAL